MKGRQKFSREFKLAAVKKIVEQGLAVTEVARDLGIAESLLHSWKRTFLEEGVVQQSPASSLEEEIKRLRAENRQLQLKRDHLKKATVFFANSVHDVIGARKTPDLAPLAQRDAARHPAGSILLAIF
ncbi:Transposase [Planctomycetales bacterium 10988]|nr:Transposase [Planctomycetales bacterium 10988]